MIPVCQGRVRSYWIGLVQLVWREIRAGRGYKSQTARLLKWSADDSGLMIYLIITPAAVSLTVIETVAMSLAE